MGKVSTDRLKLLVKMSGVFKKAESPDDEIWSEIVAIYEELLAFREGYDPKDRLPEPDHQVVVEFTVYKEPVVVDHALAVFDHAARQWVGCDGGDPWREPVEWALRWYPIGGEVEP